MTIQDANAKKDYANKHSDTKKAAMLNLEGTLDIHTKIKGPDVSLKTIKKKIKNYQDAKKRDEAKTDIPMKTNGPNMEEKFREKTIAKVKDMISKAKEKEEKLKNK
mgnify:FL=1